MKFTGIENKKYWVNYLGTKGWGGMSILMKGFEKRENHIEVRGFCILTKETLVSLTNILAGKIVLDAGAGVGYLTYHLKKKGIDIIGVVKNKKSYGFKRNFMTKRLMKGDYTTMNLQPFNAIVLSWPDYKGTHAEILLSRMKSGDMLIYVGEEYGGNCATDTFFRLLEMDFVRLADESKQLNENHVQFNGLHDYWSVYVKK